MSEQVCVCGEKESEHFPLISGGAHVTIDDNGGLLCGGFRACLDWPDSEGSYWMKVCKMATKSTVLARMEGGQIVVNNPFYSTEWMTREEYECFGKLEFIASEPNPFQGA